jgi:hypothetical protein
VSHIRRPVHLQPAERVTQSRRLATGRHAGTSATPPRAAPRRQPPCGQAWPRSGQAARRAPRRERVELFAEDVLHRVAGAGRVDASAQPVGLPLPQRMGILCGFPLRRGRGGGIVASASRVTSCGDQARLGPPLNAGASARRLMHRG